jgi:hypothetical protein
MRHRATHVPIAAVMFCSACTCALSSAVHASASHCVCSFIRASLAMNPDSFIDSFSAIQCAAGDTFEAVDLSIESRNDELIWEMTSVSASRPQPAPSNGPASGPYNCHNCRCALPQHPLVCV